jgi:hypothetical protein
MDTIFSDKTELLKGLDTGFSVLYNSTFEVGRLHRARREWPLFDPENP